MKQFSFGLGLFFFSNIAFAHTGMSSYNLSHIALHVSASIGITVALIAVGHFFYKRTAKAQHIRNKK